MKVLYWCTIGPFVLLGKVLMWVFFPLFAWVFHVVGSKKKRDRKLLAEERKQTELLRQIALQNHYTVTGH